MLTHILPMVHGNSRQNPRYRWIGIAALYSSGNVVATAIIGAGIVLMSSGLHSSIWQLRELTFWGTLLVVFIYTPRQLGWTNFPPLLQSTWQVPRCWAYTYVPELSSFYFGLGLGSGFLTRIVTPVFYLLIIWAFLLFNPLWGLIFWVIYGLARSSSLWLLALITPSDNPPFYADKMVYRLLSKERWMKRVNAIVLLTSAVWLIAGRYLQ